jgi:broad specificity phosphatase PhoE
MFDTEIELIIIRHGQSEHNAKITDDLNSKLTEKGIQQAITTGKYLKENIPNINEYFGITSPYLRCLQTSDYINREIGNRFTVETGPREAMMDYDECLIEKKEIDFPHFFWRNWGKNHLLFKKETESELVLRIENFLKQRFSHSKLIIVTHASPVSVIHDLTCRVSHDQCIENVVKWESLRNYVANCSISHVKNGESVCYGKVVY